MRSARHGVIDVTFQMDEPGLMRDHDEGYWRVGRHPYILAISAHIPLEQLVLMCANSYGAQTLSRQPN